MPPIIPNGAGASSYTITAKYVLRSKSRFGLRLTAILSCWRSVRRRDITTRPALQSRLLRHHVEVWPHIHPWANSLRVELVMPRQVRDSIRRLEPVHEHVQRDDL